MKLAKIASLAAIVPVVVGGIWWGAALASDVNKNSIHTLQAEIDRWRFLKIRNEENNPIPRTPQMQVEIKRLEDAINGALAEINSRQEKD